MAEMRDELRAALLVALMVDWTAASKGERMVETKVALLAALLVASMV